MCLDTSARPPMNTVRDTVSLPTSWCEDHALAMAKPAGLRYAIALVTSSEKRDKIGYK